MSFQLLEMKLRRQSKPSFKSISSFPVGLPLTPPPDEEFHYEIDGVDLGNASNQGQGAGSATLVAVIGVGYVGLHLVKAFAQKYNVLAFDISERRLRDVGKSLRHLPVRCTSNAADLEAVSHFLISVPTVLNPDKSIDTTYLQSAVATVNQHAMSGATVVVESSVAVGMTREFLAPLVKSRGLKVGMSPERVDPGRKFPAFESIPKVISGLDEASLESITELYGRVFETLVPVSSPEVAEMTKLYENCQRMVCAAYANEMADACATMGIDAWEVCRAAESKPFGYIPFKPGPGIGGHCIPVNPYYLLSTCSMPILQHATQESWMRPERIAARFMKDLLKTSNTELSAARLTKYRPRILVVGMGFKRGQGIMSNSPGVAIVKSLLSEWDVYVEYADPLVAQEALFYVPKMDTDEDWKPEYLETFDGILVSVIQDGLDMGLLKSLQGVLVRNYCP